MTFRSSSTGSTASSLSLVGSLPAGAQATDILIAFVGGFFSTGSRPINPPAGWTLIQEESSRDPSYSAAYWAPGNVSSLTFTSTSFAVRWNLHILAYSGRNTTTPITASAKAFTNAFGSAAAPSVTAVANDDIAVVWVNGQSSTAFGAPPAGYADLADTSTTGDPAHQTSSGKDAVTAGATGSLSRTTVNDGSQHIMITVAIAAASSGPTVSTVTTPGTTEAGNMVFTATLSGATSGSTNYAFGLTGTATAGTDYTSPLTSGMCNNGVTVVGGDFVVPTAVSSWTVTIPTTADTTDETNETIILTIGGTASTGGTITDDDPVPAWSVSDAATVTAGSPAIFTISADRASVLTQNLTLGFIDGTRVGGTGYDNTIQNSDLTNGVTISAGVLTIPAGVTSFTVSVGTV